MSKEIQPASDCIFMNPGDVFTAISSSDSISVKKEETSQSYPIDSKQFNFLSGSVFSNSKKQTTLMAVDKFAQLITSQVFKLSSLQAGLMFVDVAQNELNTSIMSFRP